MSAIIGWNPIGSRRIYHYDLISSMTSKIRLLCVPSINRNQNTDHMQTSNYL